MSGRNGVIIGRNHGWEAGREGGGWGGAGGRGLAGAPAGRRPGEVEWRGGLVLDFDPVLQLQSLVK